MFSEVVQQDCGGPFVTETQHTPFHTFLDRVVCTREAYGRSRIQGFLLG